MTIHATRLPATATERADAASRSDRRQRWSLYGQRKTLWGKIVTFLHDTIIWQMYYNCHRNKQRFRALRHQIEIHSSAGPGKPISSNPYHNGFHQHFLSLA